MKKNKVKTLDPFNPFAQLVDGAVSKAELTKREKESNAKHATAMRKIDNFHEDRALAKELEELS